MLSAGHVVRHASERLKAMSAGYVKNLRQFHAKAQRRKGAQRSAKERKGAQRRKEAQKTQRRSDKPLRFCVSLCLCVKCF